MSETTDDRRQQRGRQQRSPLRTERGSTTISDAVVSQVAGIAAQEVEAEYRWVEAHRGLSAESSTA